MNIRDTLRQQGTQRLRRLTRGSFRYVKSRFVKRDAEIWVFGNRHGFRDNGMYMFLHAAQQKNVHPIWIANTAAEAEHVRKLGYASVERFSEDSIESMRRAKLGWITTGLNDLIPEEMGGMKVVNLWHGIPLKKIGVDSQIFVGGRGPVALRRLLLRATLRRADLIVAASTFCASAFQSAFRVSSKKVQILGQPRLDAFASCPSHQTHACRRLPERFVLYAPTWRPTTDFQLETLNLAQWGSALKQNNLQLLVKLHPLMQENLTIPRRDGVVFLEGDDIDFTHLMRHAEALITDYSSCMFDFSLLERPLLLFVPDLEQYSAVQGLYVDPRTVLEPLFITEAALLAKLQQEDLGGTQLANKLKDIFYDGIAPTENCSRILDFVAAS